MKREIKMRTKLILFTGFVAAGLLTANLVFAQSAQTVARTGKAVNATDIQFEDPVQLQADGELVKVDQPGFACPSFADMDGDGLKDLLVGQFDGGKIKVYRNLGKQGFADGEWLQAEGQTAEVPGVW